MLAILPCRRHCQLQLGIPRSPKWPVLGAPKCKGRARADCAVHPQPGTRSCDSSCDGDSKLLILRKLGISRHDLWHHRRLRVLSRQRRTLSASRRSPLKTTCFTGFVPFALSLRRSSPISIQRTSANSRLSSRATCLKIVDTLRTGWLHLAGASPDSIVGVEASRSGVYWRVSGFRTKTPDCV